MAYNKLVLDKKKLAECEKIISSSIKKAVDESKTEGVVLGLSGGIDSSLVLYLACKAKVDVHAMILPEESITLENDVEDAKALAKGLGVEYSIVRINSMVNALEDTFPWKDFKSDRKRLSLGNSKARIRMILNYLAANLDNRLVLGTGNKTEILLGYATKYGDGGVDMQPIGDLYKTQVRQLASYMGIPEPIVKKVPTAGLWKGQTDEGEIGASYAEMDKILFSLVEEKKSIEEASKTVCGDVGLVKKLNDRMLRNEHKRCMPPVVELPSG